MRFDWYAATVSAPSAQVLEALSESLGGRPVDKRRGMHGYDQTFEICTADGVAARVICGGNGGAAPHAWASGEATEAFVGVVRNLWPDQHSVTRMDSAQDFKVSGAWDSLEAHCLSIADGLRLKLRQDGDYHRREDGRTLYVGSRTSPVFVRLYEKGKQLRGMLPETYRGLLPDGWDDWCRLEAQVKPPKEARQLAASLTAEQAWGFAAWTRELASVCMALDVPRIAPPQKLASDEERARYYLIAQYGGLLGRWAEECGDWKALGLQLRDEVARAKRLRQH